MGIRTTQIEPHWNYLLAIEKDLEQLSRYIEFHKDNFKCFSIELARILLASASEVDVVCKQICKNIKNNSRARSIDKYQEIITEKYPDLNSFSVEIPRYGLTLNPWSNWKTPNNSPDWWKAYNNVKHQRHNRYNQANLMNTLNSVAALFTIVLHLYPKKAEEGELMPNPMLLSVSELHRESTFIPGVQTGIFYKPL